MSPLERKWWYVALVAMFGTIATMYLMDSAGMPRFGQYNAAQWIVYILCASALWRAISFTGWLIVLMISPALAGSRTGLKTN